MDESQKAQQDFMMAVRAVAVHVLRTLYKEIIDKVEDKKVAKNLHEEFDEKVLPELPPGAKKIMYQHKLYYMVFKPVGDDYNLATQMKKIPSADMSEEDQFKLNADRDMTISAPLNYNRIVWHHSKDFLLKLMDALPMNDEIRDIQLKLDDSDGTIYIYPDGMKFGLVIEEEK